MMYSDKFVVAIKAGGKILRETKDLVHLPFGSEFSVLVKNLNSRRAKFTLHIDGTDVLGGEEIIVNANAEVEMKRFIRNGNMTEGNAFKFIERTTKIEDGPRGIKMDDGVVRVQFWFEQQAAEVVTTYHRDVWWDNYYHPYRCGIFGGPYYGAISGSLDNSLRNSDVVNASLRQTLSGTAQNSVVKSAAGAAPDISPTYNATSASLSGSSNNISPTLNDAGITVPGSKVEQTFKPVYGFVSEAASNVIVIRLVGKVGAIEVTAPVTVKTKQKCDTCGHVNKANAKFCSDCGTGLDLV